jgi:hypoxanthine phosphoribosyltransferase
MSRKAQRVPYQLDAQGILQLTPMEIAAILRGADEIIMTGGRNLLTKILKGSRDQKLLSHKLDQSPVYGYYQQLTLDEIQARVDWMILHGYLAIEYDYRLPVLCYTPKGWEIERETYARELLAGFDKMLASEQTEWDMTYLKDRDRGMILRLLDLVEATGNPKYMPVLHAWAEIDYRKVRERIGEVVAKLQEHAAANPKSYDYRQRQGVEEVSWEQFAQLAATLAEKLAGVDTIIGIARAGLFPATAVACALRRELYPVRITRRHNDEVIHAQPVWKVDVPDGLSGQVVAVVDEMADTGETLTLVAQRAKEKGAKQVITASLFAHSWANPRPDVVARVTDALVLFPWDRQVYMDGHWRPHPELAQALQQQNI